MSEPKILMYWLIKFFITIVSELIRIYTIYSTCKREGTSWESWLSQMYKVILCRVALFIAFLSRTFLPWVPYLTQTTIFLSRRSTLVEYRCKVSNSSAFTYRKCGMIWVLYHSSHSPGPIERFWNTSLFCSKSGKSIRRVRTLLIY